MRLPIGYSDFKMICETQYDLIDKSLFIKEIVEDEAGVILITRPRRFGKTLNMSMLQYFFAESIDGHPTKTLFDNFKISKQEEFCSKYQGQHPVIFLSFKDIKGASFDEVYPGLCEIIKNAYAAHAYLLSSDALDKRGKRLYKDILDKEITITQMISSLKELTRFLYLHYKKNVIVLLDEYDTPIQSAYLGQYYDQLINFFRNFFSSTLKDNPHLLKAVLTGILRVSKESLFSGLNNISTYSVLSQKYSSYFGFTESEVAYLLEAVQFSDKADEVKAWYNGYQIGDQTLYNPWSIANCIRDRKFKPYWVNTSDNALIKNLLLDSDATLRDELDYLFQNKPVVKVVDEYFVYSDLQDSTNSAIWSFLLMTGYLKCVVSEEKEGEIWCQLAIPNIEIRNLYKKMIKKWLSRSGSATAWTA